MSYDFFIAPDFHWKCHGSSFNLMFVFFCTYSQTFSYMKVNVSVPYEKTVSCIVHRLFWSQSGLQYNKRLISFKRKERSLNKQVPLFIPAEVFHEDFQLVLEDRWVVFVLYGRSGMGPCIWYARKIFQKTTISYPRNASFSENFTYALNG